MPPDLRSKLRQRTPLINLQQEAHLSIVRTCIVLDDAFEALFKPYGRQVTTRLTKQGRRIVPTGVEFTMLFMVNFVALTLTGAGAYSADSAVGSKRE